MITLYGTPRSRALRVSWALEELGLDWQFNFINFLKGDNRAQTFLGLNPSGKIPVLTDDDLVVTESAAIVSYLAAQYGQETLLPSKTATKTELARFNEWYSFIISELEQPLWSMGKHKFALPEAQRLSAMRDVAMWEFDKAAAIAEDWTPESGFLLGDKFTIIDILLCHTLMWATVFEQTIPAKLAAYRDRLQQRPALISALKKTEAIAKAAQAE
ncbi:glutathione S-transferase-like protein [Shewanella denitrificans OS217]|uniref:Glutathione S-transferase-like protein n=1 Tax=Shewanella denitrificans (strain OS217 / ATCC BAA-1090 / DSM 15013) TaxID=318161 RepID=Q12R97_SHEDO|nr:glutathione S-transferase family protein [Shewanella denitrificans]ABE54029.1 glutathione S-transferase-like protein [Shewanella denitrificans OS217]